MKPTKKYMPTIKKIHSVDQSTGEFTETNFSEINLRDYGYYKIWLSNIYDFVKIIGNKQSMIMFYLLLEMNKDNIVEKTQQEIAVATGATTKTVRECLKTLLSPIGNTPPFIVRLGTSKYRINPDIIYKGACDKRSNVQHDFYCDIAISRR